PTRVEDPSRAREGAPLPERPRLAFEGARTEGVLSRETPPGGRATRGRPGGAETGGRSTVPRSDGRGARDCPEGARDPDDLADAAARGDRHPVPRRILP